MVINSGQRYDVIVEANAEPGDYWLRANWVRACFGVANDNPDTGTGIVRYNASSTSSPASESAIQAPTTCSDEPRESLVPYLSLDVGNMTETKIEDLNFQLTNTAVFQWTVNSSTFEIDWDEPTLRVIMNDVSDFPASYNIVDVNKIGSTDSE